MVNKNYLIQVLAADILNFLTLLSVESIFKELQILKYLMIIQNISKVFVQLSKFESGHVYAA